MDNHVLIGIIFTIVGIVLTMRTYSVNKRLRDLEKKTRPFDGGTHRRFTNQPVLPIRNPDNDNFKSLRVDINTLAFEIEKVKESLRRHNHNTVYGYPPKNNNDLDFSMAIIDDIQWRLNQLDEKVLSIDAIKEHLNDMKACAEAQIRKENER